ncbi:DUF1292 domain-containing protein [Peptococcaceae bacterium]|nr:DUF1292 domain-containing protein [Peptococcaceae bacterium]MCL0106193.1 DUF1292 domain-containing protein [Peptococcaceae bacterium]
MFEHDEVITLIDEEGQEHDFTVIDILEVEEREYAILLPAEEETDEAIILKIVPGEDGSDLLVDIEDDEEWDKVVAVWEEKTQDDN